MDPIIIYADDDTDERNARPLVVNHGGTRPVPTNLFGVNRPNAPRVVRQPVVIYPNAPTAPMAPVATPPGALYQPGVGWVQNPAQAAQAPGLVQSPLGGKLGQLATPGLIQAAAMLLASFLPVPPPPTATGSVEDDVANGITYQAALAAHAKTDEKIRAAGYTLAQLL
jgi:hypothetical protein